MRVGKGEICFAGFVNKGYGSIWKRHKFIKDQKKVKIVLFCFQN
jgi:hypothetical protein